MKTKWTYLVVAALSIATVAAVDAQRGAFGKVRSAAIANKLGLSDEQKTQMEALHQAHREAIKSLRASGERPSREQMKELFFRSSRADGTDPHPRAARTDKGVEKR